jgi:hypothetical protein
MKKTICIGAVALAIVACAHASTLQQMDYKTTGDGLLVLDTSTGLEWLTATVTNGQSPNQSKNANPGYQLATIGQVITLLEDAGIPQSHVNTGTYYTLDLPAMDNFARLFHLTDVWVQYYGAQAAGWEYFQYGNLLSSAGTGWGEEYLDARNPPLGSQGAATQLLDFSNCFDCSSSVNFNFMVSTKHGTGGSAGAGQYRDGRRGAGGVRCGGVA